MKRSVSFIYIIIVIVILAVPSVGMIFAKSEWSVETTSLADPPSFTNEDGSFNAEVLSDAGDYFEDHFFARPALITADALIRKNVFASSANEKIIVGKDGWYYYDGELPVYQGTGHFSERKLKNIAHNLSLAGDYLDLLGIDMIFTVAPNKSSLYPEYMPFYMLQGDGPSDAERLKPYLEQEGIVYADLFEAFGENGEELYFKEDTHWNNAGALLAYDTIMEAASDNFGVHEDRSKTDAEQPAARDDHSGDLAEMLTPEAVTPETDYYYDGPAFSYVTDTEDNMDDLIETHCNEGTGNLYMFRDSFGASLLPFFAQEYEDATFSRLVPYSLSQALVSGADTVIIERAERNLSSFAETPPLMSAPAVSLPEDAEILTDGAEFDIREDGAYLVIEGSVDERYFSDNTEIYVLVYDENTETETVFRPFYISADSDENGGKTDDNRFMAYIMPGDSTADDLTVRIAVTE